MMKQALAKYGQVDILFNGAGVMTRIPVIDMPEEEWDRVLRINLKGTFLCSQAAAKHMIEEIRTHPQHRRPAEASPAKREHRTMRRPKPVLSPLLNPWRLSWHPTYYRQCHLPPAQPIRQCPERVRQPKNLKKERRVLRYWMG